MSPVRSVTYVSGPDLRSAGGGGGIRTPETLSSLTVFKTAAFNHSATPPQFVYNNLRKTCCTSLLHIRYFRATIVPREEIPDVQKGQIFQRHGAWHLRYIDNAKQVCRRLAPFDDRYRTFP